jgi:ABC-2 type transport system ATP-binding protein
VVGSHGKPGQLRFDGLEARPKTRRRIFGAHAAHLRVQRLRCSLTHTRCARSAARRFTRIWATWIAESLAEGFRLRLLEQRGRLPTIPLALIEVQGLTRYYADRPAIQDLTFSVPRGQVLGFLGPNGAGKSTTMRILTGYLGPSSGTASVAGFDLVDHSLEARRHIGYLPETTPLYKEMRVASFLDMMCRLRGVPASKRRARVDESVEVCGLTDRRHEVIGRLSRGLRQRVGLAQAIVHDPEVLILDEPTAGLDPAQTRETRELITALGREHTVVLSSHILPEVSATCERVLIINQGRLVADDTPANLARSVAGGEGAEIEMVVQGDRGEIERRVAALPGVGEVAISPAGDGGWRVVVKTSKADMRDELARAVVQAGFGLRELSARTLSLEDVFMHLTTEEPT